MRMREREVAGEGIRSAGEGISHKHEVTDNNKLTHLYLWERSHEVRVREHEVTDSTYKICQYLLIPLNANGNNRYNITDSK